MALPSSGAISIDQIKTELGITGELSLTDSRVRTLAGKPTGDIVLPNDLWGKAARSISIVISTATQVSAGASTFYDRYVFAVSVAGGGTPSSYSWSGDVSGFASTATFTGPTYQFGGFSTQVNGYVYVDVVIDGQPYAAELPFTYTASSELN